MAISFVASDSSAWAGNAGAIAFAALTGLQVDDLIIAAVAVGDTTNNGIAAPSEGGYTSVQGATLYANATNDTNLDVYYKFHNGTDTNITVTAVGGTNAANAGVMMAFRGVKLVADGGPFDTAKSTTSGTASSDANPPSHNWTGAAGVWTVIAASTGHTGGTAASWTFPTGYTTNAIQRASDDTIDVLVGMGYNSAPADPEDPGVLTAANIGTASANAWIAFTMSLAPAATAAVNPPRVRTVKLQAVQRASNW